MPRRRVLITGVGAASALGVGAGALWDGLVSGRSGIGPLTRFDSSACRCRLAGEIPGLTARDHVPKGYRKAVKVMARDIEIAVAAARSAVDDAGLATRAAFDEAGVPPSYPAGRLACHVGAGLIASDIDELTVALVTARTGSGPAEHGGFDLKAWGTGDGGGGGASNLQPLWLLKYLPNMLACHVTIIHGAEGPSNTITCGEASGLLSIGESSRVIERGDADASLAGSAESKINPLCVVRMEQTGRLAEAGPGEIGLAVVRPHGPEARGTVAGEGGGIVVLEEAGAAASRGARAYAAVTGFGSAQGAWSVAASGVSAEAEGDAIGRAARAAIADAGLDASEIDAVVPQGVGVASIDRAERAALGRVLGDRAVRVPMVFLAPFVGDTAAGQGGLQAVVAAKMIREQRVPAGDVLPADHRPARLRHVLACTGSVGGQAAAMVLSAP